MQKGTAVDTCYHQDCENIDGFMNIFFLILIVFLKLSFSQKCPELYATSISKHSSSENCTFLQPCTLQQILDLSSLPCVRVNLLAGNYSQSYSYQINSNYKEIILEAMDESVSIECRMTGCFNNSLSSQIISFQFRNVLLKCNNQMFERQERDREEERIVQVVNEKTKRVNREKMMNFCPLFVTQESIKINMSDSTFYNISIGNSSGIIEQVFL